MAGAVSLEQRGRIFLAGHNGMLGSGVHKALQEQGCENVIVASRAQLDLTDQAAVFEFLQKNKPDTIVICAALVGGIVANSTYPADFIWRNIAIAANLIEGARRAGTGYVVNVSSGCSYPREAVLPTREDQLLAGPLEKSNEWYAVAKIASQKLAAAYAVQHGMQAVSLVPCNLYGVGDNFDLQSSHVAPALLRKIHAAKQEGRAEVELLGTGTPVRQFMDVEDMTAAIVFALQNDCPSGDYNVATDDIVTVAELAEQIKAIVGFEGGFSWNGQLDGTPAKYLDYGKFKQLGWRPRVSLPEGLARMYAWMLDNIDSLRETKV